MSKKHMLVMVPNDTFNKTYEIGLKTQGYYISVVQFILKITKQYFKMYERSDL